MALLSVIAALLVQHNSILSGYFHCEHAFAAMMNEGHFTVRSLPEWYINRSRHLLAKYHIILHPEVPPDCHTNLPKLGEPHKPCVAA